MSQHRVSEQRGALGVVGAIALFCLATVGAVQFLHPSEVMPTAPFSRLAEAVSAPPAEPAATPTADAFGRSGNVKVRFAMPGAAVEFPLEAKDGGSTDSLRYQWVSLGDTTSDGPARLLSSASPVAPKRPGFYQLAFEQDGRREVLTEPTLAVMMPFDRKLGAWLNGYRIGTYLAERFGQRSHDHPEGFVEVYAEQLDLQVTTHLKLADFVTHDDQGDIWPKYVALNPRLLDKLELVFSDLGANVRPELAVDVHSGFRSPSHNARVPRAARDSRHQYGDAADVAIDADGDGRVTMTDELLVMLAVERVEDKHPDLVGGLGLYMSRHYRSPYVHIDARGKRSRWRG